jgi:RNA recognition motif-containing protein
VSSCRDPLIRDSGGPLVMHERGGVRMADKRRYFERDSREKEAANSGTNSESSRHNNSSNSNKQEDEPPNSRLFILCGRNVAEEELREAFDKFGTIKELWIVKDKVSQESKGGFVI